MQLNLTCFKSVEGFLLIVSVILYCTVLCCCGVGRKKMQSSSSIVMNQNETAGTSKNLLKLSEVERAFSVPSQSRDGRVTDALRTRLTATVCTCTSRNLYVNIRQTSDRTDGYDTEPKDKIMIEWRFRRLTRSHS
jgi:hypothetical protein